MPYSALEGQPLQEGYFWIYPQACFSVMFQCSPFDATDIRPAQKHCSKRDAPPRMADAQHSVVCLSTASSLPALGPWEDN